MFRSSLHRHSTCSTSTVVAAASTVTCAHHIITMLHAPPLTSRAAGQTEFTYAPEDEDIFFNVSDGSDSGSVGPPCGLEYGNAVDVPDVALSAARCVRPGVGESCCQIGHPQLQMIRAHNIFITMRALFISSNSFVCVLFPSEFHRHSFFVAHRICHTSPSLQIAPPPHRQPRHRRSLRSLGPSPVVLMGAGRTWCRRHQLQ